MKRFLLAGFATLFLFSCVYNKKENTEESLKKAMTQFLYNSINNDSSRVKYNVQDVTYFEEEIDYQCEFTVHVSVKGRSDTTGTMTAEISKDFKTVTRIN